MALLLAGLTLGGGFGWLSRMMGLSMDNLVAAEVVLADGRCVPASEHDHPNLFWALRGGGDFGVVTNFECRLQPVGPEVHVGLFFWDLDHSVEALRLCREVVPDLPRDASRHLGGRDGGRAVVHRAALTRLFERQVDPALQTHEVVAVPGSWPPVTIAGSRYIDGGLRRLVITPFVDAWLDSQFAELNQDCGRVEVLVPDENALTAFRLDASNPGTRTWSAHADLAQGRRAAISIGESWT